MEKNTITPKLIGRKQMFYLTSHSSHCVYGYMVKDHLYDERGNPLLPLHGGGGGGEREMFYLTTHSTHFIYSYMASDIWLRTILIVRKETRCRHIGYSYRLTARVLLYASSHRQDSTYHGLCYTSRGALALTRNSCHFMGYYFWLAWRDVTRWLHKKDVKLEATPDYLPMSKKPVFAMEAV